jgi:hypothetical protein
MDGLLMDYPIQLDHLLPIPRIESERTTRVNARDNTVLCEHFEDHNLPTSPKRQQPSQESIHRNFISWAC